MSIRYDSRKEAQEVRWNWERGAYWVDCDVCLYDGENEYDFTKAYALSKLKEHNHYQTIQEQINLIESQLSNEQPVRAQDQQR